MRKVYLTVLLTTLVSLSIGGPYGGGTGYWDNPYIISTPEHLNEIGLSTADYSSHFIMTADIDMSAYSGSGYNIIGTSGSAPFTGTFDGNGHTISNLAYNTAQSKSYIGFIGYGSNCTVKNLKLENLSLSSPGNSIGGLLGYGYRCTVENCSVSGTIAAGDNSQNIGGLVGSSSDGTITSSSCDITITAGSSAVRLGGLVGGGSPTLSLCYTTGSVKGGSAARSVGGLIGNYSDSSFQHSIENCFSHCDVEAGGIEVGGLVGYQSLPVIRHCFSTGNVKGGGVVGGLVGFSRITTLATDSITDSYSTSNVTLSATGYYAGGLIGYSESGQVLNCRASGSVSGGKDGMGGFVGVQLAGKIFGCVSTGNVSAIAAANNIGGFAGALWSTLVDNCAGKGDVVCQGGSGTRSIGGFSGVQDAGGVTNCYSTGSVNGGLSSMNVGGFTGYLGNNWGSIVKCFSTGAVSGTTNVGGLIGYNAQCTVTTCFWDTQSSGQTTSAGGKGKTTADMRSANTFISAGWDFVDETTNGTQDIWEMRGYPAFAFEPSIAVEGEFTVLVPQGEQVSAQLTVFNITNSLFNWTISGHEGIDWITAVTPLSGSSASPEDKTTVSISIDSTGLSIGTFYCSLLIAADNGDTSQVQLAVKVYHSINFEDFSAIGQYWKAGLCDFGDECKPYDWYVDGAIDEKDLMRLADAWLGPQIEIIVPVIEDGFETGDFSALNWSADGAAAWTATTSDKYAGQYSAKSATITDSQYTSLVLSCNTAGWAVDTLEFRYKTSSEAGYDYLRFYIDGVEKLNSSGETGWLVATFDLAAGQHECKWVYSKDSDGGSGQDCAWIDGVRIFAR